MKRDRVGFSFGEIKMSNRFVVENITEDPKAQKDAWGLKCKFKCRFIVDEVRWWLEERSICITYDFHFLFFG